MSEKEKVNVQGLENGPIDQRECRDVICCILFVVNIVAMIYCSAYGYANGNTNLIYRGTDPDGRICGVGSAATHPYLYLINLKDINTDNRVCVKACPTYDSTGNIPDTLDCLTNSKVSTCSFDWVVDNNSSVNNVALRTGFNVGYDSNPSMDRVCMPGTTALAGIVAKWTSSAETYLSNSAAAGYLSSFITDMKNNWHYLLGGFGVAIIICFIWMFLLRCIVGCMVWLSIIGLIASLAGLGFVFFYSGGGLGETKLAYSGYTVPKITSSSEYLRIYGYVCWGIAALLLVVIMCLCNRIRLAVAVCKCAGKFIVEVCSSITVPIIMAAITVILWGTCVIAMIYLVSAAPFVVQTDSIFTGISDYTDMSLVRFYYFCFGTLWCNALVQAIATFVIASACCMWYFSQGPSGELHLPVLRSFGRVFRYHLGSLAFGSLILAIVQFIQLAVELFKKQAESTGADRNKFFEYIINCVRCCLACMERIVQFINKNAYIQIALSGKNFCMAAKDGFELVWSNPLRYGIVGGVGEIIMFIGKFMIAIATTLAFYAFITFTTYASVLAPLLLLLLVFVYSYAIATIFMSVYSLAMDSILVCFIVDETQQKESGRNGAQHAPPELQELMDN